MAAGFMGRKKPLVDHCGKLQTCSIKSKQEKQLFFAMRSHGRFLAKRPAGRAFWRQKTELSVEALIPLPQAMRVFNNIRSISELSAAGVSSARLTVDADSQA